MLDVSDIRKGLEDRLAVLMDRASSLESDLRSPHSADSEERASEREGEEVLEGLEDAALREIEQIRAALRRIDEGSYGECASCGEAIAELRLKAVPYTTLCLKCADN